jgi:aspartate-semialdehyde dehydrogenase
MRGRRPRRSIPLPILGQSIYLTPVTKRHVGLLGATGIAGQQFIAALANHPWFTLSRVAASERSTGKTLREALTDAGGALRWYADGELPKAAANLTLEPAEKLRTDDLSLIFSAVESGPATSLEPLYAERMPVISAASAFRNEADVPLILPQVNPEHLELVRVQRRKRGTKGFILPIPNCTTTGLAIALKPLADLFGLRQVSMTSMQAVSGAGRSPGVAALDVIDNLVPFIPGEEEKVARETGKILGHLDGEQITPHQVRVSCTCTRVAVLEGHTEAVLASLDKPASLNEVREALAAFAGSEASGLPSAPAHWIEVHDDPYRPQPRRDRDAGGGMTTSVGRLRLDPAFDNGVKLVLVSHNTKMGAAKGAILLAELCAARGLLD